jgi:hypothetical protein
MLLIATQFEHGSSRRKLAISIASTVSKLDADRVGTRSAARFPVSRTRWYAPNNVSSKSTPFGNDLKASGSVIIELEPIPEEHPQSRKKHEMNIITEFNKKRGANRVIIPSHADFQPEILYLEFSSIIKRDRCKKQIM